MKRLLLIGRLTLLLVAGLAVVAAFALGHQHDRVTKSFAGPYACPMHPEATARAPGECPICHMALERVSASRRDPSSASPTAESTPYSFPESANLPNYKLIASAKRRVFAREVRAPAWVEPGGRVVAVLYGDELAGLAPGEPGRFFRAAALAAAVDVRLTAEPPARWDLSTSRVHFRAAPGAPALAAGDVGWVQLAARPRNLLVVPSSAVLNSPQGPYVLVASVDGETFTKRSLEVGRVIAGLTVVLSGLDDQEQVVVGNTFFLDAERRLSQRESMLEVMP